MRGSANNGSSTPDDARPALSGGGYRRLRRAVVLSTAAVAIAPLVIMTLLNYTQYEDAIGEANRQSVSRLLGNNKRSLEFFLAERVSALSYLIRQHSPEDLCSPGTLARIIRDMNRAFALGSFLDLGIIDAEGKQRCYEGPYRLGGRRYSDQDWFHQAMRRGVYTSDVFLGFRRSPHFAIATHYHRGSTDFLLRATFDAEMLSRQIHTAGAGARDDIFLVNQRGLLQTPSQRFGAVLTKMPLVLPRGAIGVDLHKHQGATGAQQLVGSARIEGSPFTLVFVKPAADPGNWRIVAQLCGFLAGSSLLILLVILWGSRLFVRSLRTENLRRAALMHEVEYSNKLASIGRLAAGMAHEINNPLAIINEKTGLLRDTVELKETSERRGGYLALIDSVLASVERCKRITHRLLGFARHMNVDQEEIDVPSLLKEVVGFLEKEASYRDVAITVTPAAETLTICSDRGQLQQVLLNLVNNAIGAVADGGRIDVSAAGASDGWLEVAIADDGEGIPEENLSRIFEPFFTTREGSGTGLGLSITYGIVNKLGGAISVASEVGQGTVFTVRLPPRRA